MVMDCLPPRIRVRSHDYSNIFISADEKDLPGFVEYMYSHILPACFVAPLKPGFDLNDGQFYLVNWYTVIGRYSALLL